MAFIRLKSLARVDFLQLEGAWAAGRTRLEHACGPAQQKQPQKQEAPPPPPKPLVQKPRNKQLLVYRYNPETPDRKPHMQRFCIDMNRCGGMVLDALQLIKRELDPTLAFRRSCREAICGTCAVNIRGTNALACITPLEGRERELRVYPLPHMCVLRDLVVDQSHFFAQYARAQPWLQRRSPPPPAAPSAAPSAAPVHARALPQSERDRAKLDGLYECILCACCSASCPPYWWHPDKFMGPAVLMQAYRWVIDSRDEFHNERLRRLADYFSVYRCHTVMNCTSCCPKNLNPGRAIAELKRMLILQTKKERPDMQPPEDAEGPPREPRPEPERC